MRNLLLIIICLLVSGCPFASDYFYLNRLSMEDETVTGIRLNKWSKVKQINQNSFLIRGGGIVALGKEIFDRNEIYEEESFYDKIFGQEMQNKIESYFIFDFGIKKINDSPLLISSRTSPTDYKIGDKGINIEIFDSLITFSEDNQVIKEYRVDFKENETKRMIVINNGDFIKVSLDCDDILIWKTKKPISEYLIFESVGSGTWEINSVTVENNIPKSIFTNREYIK